MREYSNSVSWERANGTRMHKLLFFVYVGGCIAVWEQEAARAKYNRLEIVA